MKKGILLVLFTFCLSTACLALDFYGDIDKFSEENPDGYKYDFVKYYLDGLFYIYKNEDQRNKFYTLKTNNRLVEKEKTKEYISALLKANINLRTAKNYLNPYMKPDNGLILKAASDFKNICEKLIANNDEERLIMEKWHQQQEKNQVNVFNSQSFLNDIESLSEERRESLKFLLENAILTSKVLISNRRDKMGELYQLGITEEQKDKLLKKLDDFQGDDFKGPIEESDSFLTASVLSIKEALKDETWGTLSN